MPRIQQFRANRVHLPPFCQLEKVLRVRDAAVSWWLWLRGPGEVEGAPSGAPAARRLEMGEWCWVGLGKGLGWILLCTEYKSNKLAVVSFVT